MSAPTSNQSPVPDAEFLGYVICVGDNHAKLWWAGEHWAYNQNSAKRFTDWHEAKAKMSELRNSSGSTIRTEDPPPKPTIAELEKILSFADPRVQIMPNGEVITS